MQVRGGAAAFACAFESKMSWHRTDKLMSFSMAVYNKTWNQNREGSGSFEAPHGMRTLGA